MMIAELLQLSEEEINAVLAELPDDEAEYVEVELRKARDARNEKLAALAQSIAEQRSEAIKGRSNSGIEDEWLEDEEHYEGIDDANRGESKTAWNSKPVGREMPDSPGNTGSTVFLNVTRPYCDAAGASLADMLMPTDEDAWQLAPTPKPEFIPIEEMKKISRGEFPPQMAAEMERDAKQQAAQTGKPPDALLAEKQERTINQANEMLAEASDKARAAQQRIRDWHVESQYHAEARKVIEDAARVGSGVFKGPYPAKRRHVAYMDGGLVVQEEIKPVSRRINYWNLFPDPGCGENIHDGSYIFERDDITPKKLRDLIGVDGYLEDQIMSCLNEGPKKIEHEYKPVDEMSDRDTKNMFEIWYYHGYISKEQMEAAGCECEHDHVPAQITLVNNRVIKATLNPLDTGDFPYDIMVWQERRGLPWGMGVSRQIRTPQRMINAAARNLMDNAGLAGGPMWAYMEGLIRPADGQPGIGPRKGWIANEDADIRSIQEAFTYFKLDIMVNELQAIIYLGLKMAEDVTGLPMIMQGQMGAQKLDTLGQTQILNNNANIVRRRIARLFDDRVTEPHVRRYYSYLLQYGEDEEKGEFVIDARGSSNLVERAMQKEQSIQLLELSLNPVYGIDPKKAIAEYLRAENLDPRKWEYDDDEWQQIVANMSQQQDTAQQDRAAAAQLQAEVRMAVAEMQEAGKDRREAAKLQAEASESDKKRQFDAAMEQFQSAVEKELELMRHESKKTINFDDIRARLNDKVLSLKHTEKLVALNARADQLPEPPVEPPGLAPVGESYQK